ncbi:hypothetical protein [Pedosphaera parvula]|uniref:Uncharacterized protein n=1 Tax=Pedosphaera parvula (strain Ellin514) TaxID=320771 RepID=B9XNM4_PEDPL|nr:hypothetical protein [Pedosphaera parvula]EEF58564.1 hypothetical protein Cflav_PD1754 [Pedosphaera parvula Ellin514]
MALNEVKKELKKVKAKIVPGTPKPRPRPEEPRSKELPFDAEVPGDRGDREKKSLTQGSE